MNSSIIDSSEIISNLRASLVISYCVVFVVGTIGNVITIFTVTNVLLTIRRQDNPTSSKHVFLYVLGLSVADLLLLSHIPFLCVTILYLEWIFGETFCNVYWITESVNKLLSTLILALLSWDRWIAVTRPFTAIKFRKMPIAFAFLLILIVLSVLFQLPVLMNVTIIEPVKYDVKLNDTAYMNESVLQNLNETFIQNYSSTSGGPQCTSALSNSRWWILLLFSCGYCIPAILMSFFYISLVKFLKKSDRRVETGRLKSSLLNQHSQPRATQVTIRIVKVVIFYFLCWTPYWFLQLMNSYRIFTITYMTYTIQVIMHMSHLLVAVNSALNPIFYALLNRELRNQHDTAMRIRRQTLHVALGGAFDTIERHGHWLANKFKHAKNETDPNEDAEADPAELLLGAEDKPMTTTSVRLRQIPMHHANGIALGGGPNIDHLHIEQDPEDYNEYYV